MFGLKSKSSDVSNHPPNAKVCPTPTVAVNCLHPLVLNMFIVAVFSPKDFYNCHFGME